MLSFGQTNLKSSLYQQDERLHWLGGIASDKSWECVARRKDGSGCGMIDDRS